MIANPAVPAYRYDPYARKLTREYYDQAGVCVYVCVYVCVC